MPYSLNLSSRITEVAAELQLAMDAPGNDLAPAALAIARVEYPSLDSQPYLATLDRMGEEAHARIGATSDLPQEESVRAFNEYLYDEQGFAGNRERYDDPRNSFLNEVLDRRTGIPISLAVIYLEVARRAGLRVDGVNFPGTLPAPGRPGEHLRHRYRGRHHRSVSRRRPAAPPTIAGNSCGSTSATKRRSTRRCSLPATRHDIVVRMLVNLKRLYVRMRSFPQARFISTLLLGVDPSAISELRDRGLLAYHLQDFAGALRDLEEYLRLAPKSSEHGEPDLLAEQDDGDDAEGGDHSDDEEAGDDATQIWEHVKTLRRRVAGFN